MKIDVKLTKNELAVLTDTITYKLEDDYNNDFDIINDDRWRNLVDKEFKSLIKEHISNLFDAFIQGYGTDHLCLDDLIYLGELSRKVKTKQQDKNLK